MNAISPAVNPDPRPTRTPQEASTMRKTTSRTSRLRSLLFGGAVIAASAVALVGGATDASPTAGRTDVLPVACRLVDDRPGAAAATETLPTSLGNQRRIKLVQTWDGGTGRVERSACNIPGDATAAYVRISARRSYDAGGPSWLEAGFCMNEKPSTSKMAAVPVGREFGVVSGWVTIAPVWAGTSSAGAVLYDRQFCVWAAAPGTQVFIDVEAVLVP